MPDAPNVEAPPANPAEDRQADPITIRSEPAGDIRSALADARSVLADLNGEAPAPADAPADAPPAPDDGAALEPPPAPEATPAEPPAEAGPDAAEDKGKPKDGLSRKEREEQREANFAETGVRETNAEREAREQKAREDRDAEVKRLVEAELAKTAKQRDAEAEARARDERLAPFLGGPIPGVTNDVPIKDILLEASAVDDWDTIGKIAQVLTTRTGREVRLDSKDDVKAQLAEWRAAGEMTGVIAAKEADRAWATIDADFQATANLPQVDAETAAKFQVFLREYKGATPIRDAVAILLEGAVSKAVAAERDKWSETVKEKDARLAVLEEQVDTDAARRLGRTPAPLEGGRPAIVRRLDGPSVRGMGAKEAKSRIDELLNLVPN